MAINTCELKTKTKGTILEVTLDRPKANAIDLLTSRKMGEIFMEFRDNPKLRVATLNLGLSLNSIKISPIFLLVSKSIAFALGRSRVTSRIVPLVFVFSSHVFIAIFLPSNSFLL